MDIQQNFSVPFPIDTVWRSFHDTAGLVACLPGAALAQGWETAPADKLPLSMTVKLGPIVAAFTGEGAITLDDAGRRGAVTGSGVDRKSGSRVKGEASFSLHGIDGVDGDGMHGLPGTRVEITVDFSIAGSLAQFSRGGIVKELAARLTEAFAANLKQKLEAEADIAAPLASQDGSGAQAEQAEQAEQGGPTRTTAVAAAADPAATPPESPAATPASPATPATPQARPRVAPPVNAPLDVGALFWPALWARLRQMLGLQPRR